MANVFAISESLHAAAATSCNKFCDGKDLRNSNKSEIYSSHTDKEKNFKEANPRDTMPISQIRKQYT